MERWRQLGARANRKKEKGPADKQKMECTAFVSAGLIGTESGTSAPFLSAEEGQSGPRRQGFADAAHNAPLTAPSRSERRSARKGRGDLGTANKSPLTSTGLFMEGDSGHNPVNECYVKIGTTARR